MRCLQAAAAWIMRRVVKPPAEWVGSLMARVLIWLWRAR
jgi:hypothetical protein